ncbi:DNA-binding protein [Mycena floridula]|nr:DNA-binding protein [Mycena floridula]
MSTKRTLTFNQTVRGITEFIEVAIHTILYVRQIYPADLFVRRKKYETPVFQSRHPGLNQYISGAMKFISDELVLGTVDKIVVVIKGPDDVALERFLFSIDNILQVELYDKDTSVESALTPGALAKCFRSFLVKLNMIESQLGQLYLADGASFAILLETKEGKKPTASKKSDIPPWMPAVAQHTTKGAAEDAEVSQIRAVQTGIINLSLSVEESDVKFQREREMAAYTSMAD